MRNRNGILLLAVLMIGTLGMAHAECVLHGTCEVEVNTESPEMGYWKYTLEVTWDTGSHGLSHLDLLLGYENHNCLCEQFDFEFDDIVGSGVGWEDSRRKNGFSDDDPCTIYYEGFFECWGDPSIPGVYAPLVKFEPIEKNNVTAEDDCEPGQSGSMTVCFYSDWMPVAAQAPNEWLVIKYGQYSCYGQVDGVVPELNCINTAAEDQDWGKVKKQY